MTLNKLKRNLKRASAGHTAALQAFKNKTGDFDNLQAAAAQHQQAINELDGFQRSLTIQEESNVHNIHTLWTGNFAGAEAPSK